MTDLIDLQNAYERLRVIAQNDPDPSVQQTADTAVRIIRADARGTLLTQALSIAEDTGRSTAIREKAIEACERLITSEIG